ncbi:MAG: peptidoglycan-associated lipoprotein Pal [Rubricella sp.]
MIELLRKLALVGAIAALAACSQTAQDTAGAGTAGANAGASTFPEDSVEYFTAEIGDRVFFATDSSSLDVAAQTTLTFQADWLLRYPDRTVVIEGHADERGTREYNLALGARRAQAVYDYLVSLGVPASRLTTVTYGKERPVALCSNESCWSQNRRGVSVISAGSGV